MLLKRYKLSPTLLQIDQFRQRFAKHRKDLSSSWPDFAFEINTFLDEWLTRLEIKIYDELRDFIIVDQIRNILPRYHREHVCDKLPKVRKREDLINKLNDYGASRNNVRKTENRHPNSDFRKRPTQKTATNKVFHRNDVNHVPNKKKI